MKYRDIPKAKFKKGTPKRIRMAVKHVHESLWFRNGEQYQKAMQEAYTDMLFYGESAIQVCWEDNDIKIKNVT